MDPSLSISSDPHHPPQFTPFPPFPSSNPFISGGVPAPNHHPFGGPNPYMNNNNNNHVFQPQTQTQIPQPPMMQASPHPPYSEMICAAIAALNEPDGSSKMAISRYMERCHTGLPAAHGALLTHHLKTLKNSGVLAMVKKSYKFAASSTPPESVAVAAAAAAQGLDVPRSEILPPINTVNDPMSASASGSASQPQKRGRGRPPKPKPEAPQQQQPINVQPNQVQSNGQPIWEQQQVELPVAKPAVPVTESVKRGPGRPRKDGAASAPIVQASVMPGIMKRRGRPPGRRAAGRQRKPKSVSATVSVFPYVANGVRRRGRPRRVDSISTTVAAPEGGQVVAAIAPGMKRGRGRPPKIGGVSVMSRLIKPKRGRGRPVGRPRKIATSVTTGTQDSGELKRKFDIFQEKVKEIVNVLKAGVTTENQAVMQAIKDLEGLTVTETVTETATVEPQAMEEVQPEETAEPLAGAQAEAAETHGGGQEQEQVQEQEQEQVHEQGQEREGGEAQAQTQTEAEAMQEALF